MGTHNTVTIGGHFIFYMIELLSMKGYLNYFDKFKINMDKKPETSQLLAALYQFLLECFVILPISTYFVVIPLLKLRGFESKFPSITAIFCFIGFIDHFTANGFIKVFINNIMSSQ